MIVFGRWSLWFLIALLTLLIAAALVVSQPILALALVVLVIVGFVASRAGSGE